MSFKSLLFCPDERTARVVTQVLSELEFTVEPANDPFSAVKKLHEERYDALVVDCQTEQDASLLFKTARDSGYNHSALSVAVVEGQTGVAKAFRIGANLVLTKPINVEQSKGTLRVARGLLRKNEAKPSARVTRAAAKTIDEAPVFTPKPLAVVSPVVAEPASPVPSAVAAMAPDKPFSALEVESDATPEPEATEVAVLESLPELSGKPAAPNWAPVARSEAEPIAAASSGQAAAVARALEKTSAIELKGAGMAPMVTNEPIVTQSSVAEPFSGNSVEAPSFSTLDSMPRESGGGAKLFKVAGILLALGVAGYFGWQKLQPMQHLQHIPAAHLADSSVPASPSSATTASPTQPASVPQPSFHEETPAMNAEPEISASGTTTPHSDNPESIDIQELPISRDTKSSVAPKAEPLIVKPDIGGMKSTKSAQPTPPPVQVFETPNSSATVANLVTTNAAVPKLEPSTVRISQGVSQGLLLKKVPPVYPSMALQLHKEGNVDLLATISKQGVITNVNVLSGDAMLAKPAADAVRQWKYRPYLLNGEPVEIQTQITIKFTAPR